MSQVFNPVNPEGQVPTASLKFEQELEPEPKPKQDLDLELDDELLLIEEDVDETESDDLTSPLVSTEIDPQTSLVALGAGQTEVLPESERLPHPIQAWKVLIVDDEPSVHQSTQLALKNFTFEDKPLVFLSAYSGEEAKILIEQHRHDLAVILLDVVMESDDAGLTVVRYIRKTLNNHCSRIVLRTGQPGYAPAQSVILNYDINDYQLKVDLTRQRLLMTILSGLRSFRDIMLIENQRLELAQTLDELRQMQQQLTKYSCDLELEVSQRTAELEQANHKLRQLASLDALTHLANRRCVDEYLCLQWKRLAMVQQPLSLLLLDVDYFKFYNDTYGHLEGDQCLQHLAEALKDLLVRPKDMVARYGGEEFLIVLPNTPLKGACHVAERLLKLVHDLSLPHSSSQIADHVTLSIGVSWLIPQANFSYKNLIEMADRALYQAKASGRDRYCIYGEDSQN